MKNADMNVVRGFGDEWSRFDQSALPDHERTAIFESYFAVFPWHELSDDSIGADFGCGSGRWALMVAPRVGTLHCVDASAEALAVARTSLARLPNVHFFEATVGQLPFDTDSLDFAYSLGVLHHVPDITAALRECVRCLKPGAPFLLYLYYAFGNRGLGFRAVWRASDLVRRVVSRLPHPARYAVSQALAALVYIPLARGSALLERAGMNVDGIPLSFYRDKTLYTMRTDALDRFGTRIEQRFTRSQMMELMKDGGLENIVFSEHTPYWCAVGYKADA
ncbi:MAG: class I SAM-dependent methyltransferase [Longimicrobiales bacterium]